LKIGSVENRTSKDPNFQLDAGFRITTYSLIFEIVKGKNKLKRENRNLVVRGFDLRHKSGIKSVHMIN